MSFNAIFLDPNLKDLPKEILEWKDTVFTNNLIFGRKAFEDLAQKYFEDKIVWVITKSNPYGWLHCTNKNRNLINIVTNINDLPDNLNYTVCGGNEIFNLFADKITEAYLIGDFVHPFKLKSEEIILTKDGVNVKKLT